ncbi:MAG: hypothetical protein NC186_08500 [Prevotella sp.]|nr:hypothetical protein [Prevotella sp.]
MPLSILLDRIKHHRHPGSSCLPGLARLEIRPVLQIVQPRERKRIVIELVVYDREIPETRLQTLARRRAYRDNRAHRINLVQLIERPCYVARTYAVQKLIAHGKHPRGVCFRQSGRKFLFYITECLYLFFRVASTGPHKQPNGKYRE